MNLIKTSNIVVVNSYDMLFAAALTRKGIDPKNFHAEDYMHSPCEECSFNFDRGEDECICSSCTQPEYVFDGWLKAIYDILLPYEPEDDDLEEWDDDLGKWDVVHGGYSEDPRPYWVRMEE